MAASKWRGQKLARLRADYEERLLSLKDIAKKHETSENYMMILARRNRWERRKPLEIKEIPAEEADQAHFAPPYSTVDTALLPETHIPPAPRMGIAEMRERRLWLEEIIARYSRELHQLHNSISFLSSMTANIPKEEEAGESNEVF
ncbi:MAG: hypothetical protein EBU49_00060 [Proteobacteria bacterium]|nr:hypothetical protein [Pseudomonadota bacterium]